MANSPTFADVEVGQHFTWQGITFKRIPQQERDQYGTINAVAIDDAGKTFPGDTGHRFFYDDEVVSRKAAPELTDLERDLALGIDDMATLQAMIETVAGGEALRLRYDEAGNRLRSYDEIADILEMDRWRVRQLCTKAIRRLRHPNKTKQYGSRPLTARERFAEPDEEPKDTHLAPEHLELLFNDPPRPKPAYSWRAECNASHPDHCVNRLAQAIYEWHAFVTTAADDINKHHLDSLRTATTHALLHLIRAHPDIDLNDAAKKWLDD